MGELEVRRMGGEIFDYTASYMLWHLIYITAGSYSSVPSLFRSPHPRAYTFIPVEFNWQTPKHNFRRAAKFCNGTREKKRIFRQHLSFYLRSVGNKWDINISSGVENWWFPAISRTQVDQLQLELLVARHCNLLISFSFSSFQRNITGYDRFV